MESSSHGYMIRSLEELDDATVEASDGPIGKVHDFLFDDRSWMIRYLVVGVRAWMAHRDVIITPEAIAGADWEKKILHAQLTRAQVEASPGPDSRRPVSQQQHIALRYGWHAYRNDPPPSAVAARVKRDYPRRTGDDPHLRSAEDVTGYQVWEGDENLGRVESFVLNNSPWHIGYLEVDAGSWTRHRSILIPTPWIASISWARLSVTLKHALQARA